jgi:drug/metabolite transporter (DMT)-like permease
MTVAMLSIPLVDGLAKYLSVGYSPLFLSWARYAVACVVVLPFAAVLHGRRLFPAERRGAHVFRTVFLVTAMTLYFLSVARIPLATAVSTCFVGPIMAAVCTHFPGDSVHSPAPCGRGLGGGVSRRQARMTPPASAPNSAGQ